MQLNYQGLKAKASWKEAGIELPSFDPAELAAKTGSKPRWIHFGPGNLFRGYIAHIAQRMIEAGALDRALFAVETMPSELLDAIWTWHDNLALQVCIHASGKMDKRVIGSVSHLVKSFDPTGWQELLTLAKEPDMAYVSFTITEKGYQLEGLDGELKPTVKEDIDRGPDSAEPLRDTPVILAAMLVQRYRAGAGPITLMSFDNFSHNGEKLYQSLKTVLTAWQQKGFIDEACCQAILSPDLLSCPNACIDKITPGANPKVAEHLAELGLEDLGMLTDSRGRQGAAFVNTETAEYLVVENRFAGGQTLALDKGSVYLTDKETVDRFERMKVCTCLNPLHTSLAVLGCLLKSPSIAAEMADPDLKRLVQHIGYVEGLPVVVNPGIIDPEAFLAAVLEERFPNPYVPDVPQRIACDTSQKVGIRFGETMLARQAKGDLSSLKGIPFVIAAWARYLLAVDDEGQSFEPSPDPLLAELQPIAQKAAEHPTEGCLAPLLSQTSIFRIDLVAAGLAPQIEAHFARMLEGPGSVRRELQSVLAEVNA